MFAAFVRGAEWTSANPKSRCPLASLLRDLGLDPFLAVVNVATGQALRPIVEKKVRDKLYRVSREMMRAAGCDDGYVRKATVLCIFRVWAEMVCGCDVDGLLLTFAGGWC